MSGRLIRALQSGGMASKLERDLWGIWRGRDRRRRMIGTLPGADVDVLRARDCLFQVGEAEPAVLIWSGPAEPSPSAAASPRALQVGAPDTNSPMLLTVLATCHDPALRETYRRLANAYRKDTELADQFERSPGMNWGNIALGTRVAGGHIGRDVSASPYTAQARSRLRKLSAQMTADEIGFLDALILREDNRTSLAKQFALPASGIASRATYLLRSLRDLYPIEGGY